MKPWQYRTIFLVCLTVVLAAMGWISAIALKLDHARAEAARTAAFEENVRLALWRMETVLAPILARESARPYFVYSAFYSPERAYTKMFEEVGKDEVMVPSPLLTEAIPNIILHFQLDSQMRLTAPEAPQGKVRAFSGAAFNNEKLIDLADAHLTELARRLDRRRLLDLLTVEEFRPAAKASPRRLGTASAHEKEESQKAVAPQTDRMLAQAGMNSIEWSARNSLQSRAMSVENVVQGFASSRPGTGKRAASAGQAGSAPTATIADADGAGASQLAKAKHASRAEEEGVADDVAAPSVREGVMKPLWIGDTLVLARRVAVNGRTYVQGCWLDWNGIRKDLLRDIADLLPAADLQPASSTDRVQEGRLLAGLPVRLVPGRMLAVPSHGMTPVQFALIVAWLCVLAGAGAVAWVLAGAISLSERRAAFVSAVTHELRTPLTTFRMYTEMLANDMVPDPSARRAYLATLSAEANRLNHLIENVLSYARIERGRAGGRVERLAVEDLLDRVKARLAQRAEQAGMELAAAVDAQTATQVIRADVSAVEQILFNLVDNACKYAATADDKRIHVETALENRSMVVRVRDHGAGISRADARRLFQPFSKSAKHAAESAPGVGLGLALCRRLARQMGGTLRLCHENPHGACFEFTLPLDAA